MRPDLLFPNAFESDVRLDSHPDATFKLRALWNEERLAYDLVELRIKQRGGLSSESLRDLSRNDLMQAASVLLVEVDLGDRREQLAWSRETFNSAREAGPTDETLRHVARLYASSRAFAPAPNKAVVRAFEIPQRTATRWIAAARQKGLLD